MVNCVFKVDNNVFSAEHYLGKFGLLHVKYRVPRETSDYNFEVRSRGRVERVRVFVIFLGEEKLACDILEQLSHVERFDMVLLFMSPTEKNGKGVFIVKRRDRFQVMIT